MVTSEARDLRFVSKGKTLELEGFDFLERWLKAQWKVVEQLLNAAILSEGEAFSDKISHETKNKKQKQTKNTKMNLI